MICALDAAAISSSYIFSTMITTNKAIATRRYAIVISKSLSINKCTVPLHVMGLLTSVEDEDSSVRCADVHGHRAVLRILKLII